MMRPVAVGFVLLAVASAAAAGAPVPDALDPVGEAPMRMEPIVQNTDEDGRPVRAERPERGEGTSDPLPPIRVDPNRHTVRVPVAFSRAEGLVVWLLSSGGRCRHTSVLVTRHKIRHLAMAFRAACFPEGRASRQVDDGRAGAPEGVPVEIDVVVTRAEGDEVRFPAALFLAERSGGDSLENGQWVYTGPRTLQEDDVALLVTELSGSVVTTNLGDSSAFIHWVPTDAEAGGGALRKAYYLSGVPLPEEGYACEVEIRLVASENEAADAPKDTPAEATGNGSPDNIAAATEG